MGVLGGCSDPFSPSSAIDAAKQSQAEQGRRFTIPSQYFGSQTESEAREMLTKNGATDITKNSDGTYTVTMADDVFDTFCKTNKEQTENALHALAQNDTYPGLTNVDISDDLRNVTVSTTNAEQTQAETDAGNYVIYLVCLYQTIAGDPLMCTVNFVNPAGQTIYTTTYPN